jgi:flagellar hook-basal body complex protein FliE
MNVINNVNDISGLANINELSDLIFVAFNKKIKKLKAAKIEAFASELNIEKTKINQNSKKTKKNKNDFVTDINNKIKEITLDELLDLIKKTKVGIELEVKSILSKGIDIDDLINTNICLPLDKFLEENSSLNSLFINTCDLININNTIKSNNCQQNELQGLYVLTICKNNVDYIVKLGSFAESQGMYKRITSFGGGNYETGSLTNKWFQAFIKKAIEKGYSSKFTYYNKIQEKILIDNLDGGKIEMIPYVMRPLETELFKKYNASNNNIPPIFGSNCGPVETVSADDL